jgi:hypothetical protein
MALTKFDATQTPDVLPKASFFGPFQAPVQATSTTSFSTTSSTYQNTNLSATITPTSSSHRIKITFSGNLRSADRTLTNAFLSLKRGSTDLSLGGNPFYALQFNGNNLVAGPGVVYIDSPATTSAVTYTVTLKNSDNATTVLFGDNSGQVMILEEVA